MFIIKEQNQTEGLVLTAVEITYSALGAGDSYDPYYVDNVEYSVSGTLPFRGKADPFEFVDDKDEQVAFENIGESKKSLIKIIQKRLQKRPDISSESIIQAVNKAFEDNKVRIKIISQQDGQDGVEKFKTPKVILERHEVKTKMGSKILEKMIKEELVRFLLRHRR